MNQIQTSINTVTLEETAPDVEAAFPYRTDICDLGEYAENLCPWHWHNEVELFFMESGSLTYTLPSGSYDFHPGDAGFVNANVLHMTRGSGQSHCRQQEHIFLPRLVSGASGSAIERNYVLPLTHNPAADILVVPAADPVAEGLRRLMDEAHRAYRERPTGYELLIRDRMGRIWLELLARMPDGRHGRPSADGARIKAMLRYIERNFARPIALEDIAAAASIGVRECSRCFRRQLNLTPIDYLLSYRVDRACEALRNTDLPVTEVALNCGFSSASYFGKLFRERLGMSPSQYRRAEQ